MFTIGKINPDIATSDISCIENISDCYLSEIWIGFNGNSIQIQQLVYTPLLLKELHDGSFNRYRIIKDESFREGFVTHVIPVHSPITFYYTPSHITGCRFGTSQVGNTAPQSQTFDLSQLLEMQFIHKGSRLISIMAEQPQSSIYVNIILTLILLIIVVIFHKMTQTSKEQIIEDKKY